MEASTFLKEKERLLAEGFEVDVEPILATNIEQAMEKYRSGFLNDVDEYRNSDVAAGLFTFITETIKSLRQGLKGSPST
ncbi:hypothetical protein DBZ36_15555 [Alginatibacterium sediminis]|uniref:Uncharacterized protein n=1 Tax=Alginatibacterium sediminis TaxID=2164068 RepID=A0A420E8G7_9ALTE|nr:hypothetical protein [Alginatibacterium sediminis]RKF15789.1 hypothetical protein DBZ36_15555 [Alginatibacterium sediminis]